MGARAAIYLRVSKGERHTDNQRPDVERVVSMRGLELVAEGTAASSLSDLAIAALRSWKIEIPGRWTFDRLIGGSAGRG